MRELACLCFGGWSLLVLTLALALVLVLGRGSDRWGRGVPLQRKDSTHVSNLTTQWVVKIGIHLLAQSRDIPTRLDDPFASVIMLVQLVAEGLEDGDDGRCLLLLVLLLVLWLSHCRRCAAVYQVARV